MNYPPKDLQLYLDASYSVEAVADWLTAEGQVLVAEGPAGELLGFAQSGLNTLPFPAAEAGDRELKRLYVARRAQGLGLGRRLTDLILEPLCDRRVLLSVWSGNHRARRFYELYGFKEAGRNPFQVGDHVDDDLIYLREPLPPGGPAPAC